LHGQHKNGGLKELFGCCRTLGALAEKCHAFAKALHYKELEFASTPETAVEALISINNQLRQPEAAVGILAVAQNELHMELKVAINPIALPLE
jgi:phosphatidylinositol kinase/protein kinase (PI-3  family)